MKKAVLLFAMCAALAISFSLFASGPAEAPTGFDGLTNGSVVQDDMAAALVQFSEPEKAVDRKSTRLNSSHGYISYAVFCLKKKKKPSLTTPLSTTVIRGTQAARGGRT